MGKCECSMSISVLGDGCRYCQPQEYIDRLHDQIEDERDELGSRAASVTDDDRNMIAYFLQEKGDIERWSGWEDRKADIGRVYPELIDALDRLKIAERTLDAVVDRIAQEVSGE